MDIFKSSKKIEALIYKVFLSLFFLTPIILYPKTSEIFEFNKMIFVYLSTSLITGLWILKIILRRKFFFKKTAMDIPLVVFLASQSISTLLSIDTRASLLGHYSRFNGGLASTLAYVLLFWAYTNNIDKKKSKKIILTSLFSALLVSIYGIFQHFGIDKNLWVQDVQSRIFSTLGQPNWLAAMLIGLLPFTWYFYEKGNFNFLTFSIKKNVWVIISAIFFLTLIYTKSKSGILGFGVSAALYWGIRLQKKKKIRIGVLFAALFASLLLIFETPWVPNIESYLKSKSVGEIQKESLEGPVLETGGTESGKIRQIVWKGAFETWKKYPVFGTGVETFAFSYPNFRPIEHNLISEWDFIYNKAHNEFLNLLSTTGIVGLLSYLFIIATFYSTLKKKGFKKGINLPIAAGFTGIVVTNFFGFSVVQTSLLFFLFPAFVYAQGFNERKEKIHNTNRITLSQKILLTATLFSVLFLLTIILKYWYSDILYKKGKTLNTEETLFEARGFLTEAIALNPKEAVFWNEISQNSTDIAISLPQDGSQGDPLEFVKKAIEESDTAISLSPENVALLRSRSVTFIKFSIIDQQYLESAEQVITSAISLSPTDAKLYYNLGLTQARLGKLEESRDTFKKAVEMKSNYVNARFALGLILDDLGERILAIKEFEYILENLDPDNALVKNQLEDIR